MTFQDGRHRFLSLVCHLLYFVQFSRCDFLNYVEFRFQYLILLSTEICTHFTQCSVGFLNFVFSEERCVALYVDTRKHQRQS